MLARLFTDGVIYGGANVLSKAAMILLVPVYARVFSPQEMGVVDIIFVFTSLAAIIVPVGITNGVARYFVDANRESERSAYASSAWWFTVGAYVVFGIGAIAFAEPISSVLLSSDRWVPLLRIAIAAQVILGLQYFLQTLLRWRLQARLFAICNVVTMVTTVSAIVTLLLLFDSGVAGVYYGQIAGAIIGLMLAWYFNRDVLGWHLNPGATMQMLRYSLPLLPALLGELIGNYVDRAVIRSTLSIDDVGVYGIGYRFAAVVGLLMSGFSAAITPLVLAQYRKPGTPQTLARVVRYFTALAIIAICGLLLFAREILWLFVTSSYYGAQPVIPLLGAALLLFGMYSFAPGLSIAMKTRTIAGIHVATGAMNAILSVILTPLLGIVGAATATLCSAITTAFLYFLFSQRHYPVPHNWRQLLISVGVAVTVAAAGVVVVESLPVSPLSLVAKFVVYCLAAATVLIRLVGRDELRLAHDWLRFKCRI